MQFTSASAHQARTLGGRPYVEGCLLSMPTLMLGDVHLARDMMAKEGSDIMVGYPPSTAALLGANNVSVVTDRSRHATLRRLLNPAFRQVSPCTCTCACTMFKLYIPLIVDAKMRYADTIDDSTTCIRLFDQGRRAVSGVCFWPSSCAKLPACSQNRFDT